MLDESKPGDVLLICDEVQIGNGRSGMLYGYMNYGIQPDIFTTAKGRLRMSFTTMRLRTTVRTRWALRPNRISTLMKSLLSGIAVFVGSSSLL